MARPADGALTARGARTRAALVAAARTVFERDGYLGSRLVDITAEAGCATGTFYTWFSGKEEIFAAVLEAAKDDMLHPGAAHVDPTEGADGASGAEDPVAVIEASTRAYLEAYQRNARLMVLQEQVATIDAEFRQRRLERGDAFIRRNAQGIERLQQRGLVDERLDPVMTATALSSMVGRLAYSSFGLGAGWSVDELVETCTLLWANALGLDPGPRARGGRGPEVHGQDRR